MAPQQLFTSILTPEMSFKHIMASYSKASKHHTTDLETEDKAMLGVQGFLRRAQETVHWPGTNKETTDYIQKGWHTSDKALGEIKFTIKVIS